MKILVAPDSFKGSLSAAKAAEAMAAGVRRVRPEAEIVRLPLADGGEGTVEAFILATAGHCETAQVTGPLGESVEAVYGWFGSDRKTAVLEMASAAGLNLVPADKRDPRRTTTYGVGEILRQIGTHQGVERVIIGLGGSATNEGGAGALQALGVRFLDSAGRSLPEPITGGDLARLARMDVSSLRFPEAEVVIASDVTNPLLGPNGASAVYGPQKGADDVIVAELEATLTNYAAVVHRDLGKDVASLPGAGAAGGMGAGLLTCLDARMRSGIDLVLDAAKFEEQAVGSDWLLTGEGRIDAQTLEGKTIAGLVRRCRAIGVPIIAFGGAVEDAASEHLAASGLRAAFSIVSGPMTLEDAMQNGAMLLTQAVSRVLRLL